MSRRSRRGNRAGGPRAQISMDSLIDLTFLLLVTFMVTLPVLEQGIPVQLPRAEAKPLPHKDAKANRVTVNDKNEIFMNNDMRKISLGELEAKLKQMVAEDPDVPVLVCGDEHLEYGAVMDVVKTVYKCQVRKMALVTKGE